MGTNALVKHGFTVTHSDGTQVEPHCKDANVSTTSVKVINVLLNKTVHLSHISLRSFRLCWKQR